MTRRGAGLLFGRAEALTWATLRLALRLLPATTTKLMLREFTTLPVADMLRRMPQDDRAFVRRMLLSMRSGTGFRNDLEHRVDQLAGIRAPVLVMYSPHDRSVPPAHAQRVAREIAHAELYAVPADSHLIWIGPSAAEVWARRLAFLQA